LKTNTIGSIVYYFKTAKKACSSVCPAEKTPDTPKCVRILSPRPGIAGFTSSDARQQCLTPLRAAANGISESHGLHFLAASIRSRAGSWSLVYRQSVARMLPSTEVAKNVLSILVRGPAPAAARKPLASHFGVGAASVAVVDAAATRD
jgi:hypothetical protein